MVNAMNPPAAVTQVSSSEDTTMGDDTALSSLLGCKPDQVCSRMLALAFPFLTNSDFRAGTRGGK